jgi:hypothetical protein
MRFAGVLPEDAPDPRTEARQRLLGLPFPLMALAPQPAIEGIGAPGIEESTDGAGRRSHLAAIFSYVLWRNPEDHADPVNLKDLDEQEHAEIENAPPWPRPAWLIEYVEMMRYPQLWEAVRTSWYLDDAEHTTLSQQLIDHTSHILVNQFREHLGLQPDDHDGPWQVGPSSVRTATVLEIDGREVPAAEIDTDPLVYAIGAQIRPDVVTTIVVDREHLPYLRLALTTWNPALG